MSDLFGLLGFFATLLFVCAACQDPLALIDLSGDDKTEQDNASEADV